MICVTLDLLVAAAELGGIVILAVRILALAVVTSENAEIRASVSKRAMKEGLRWELTRQQGEEEWQGR